MTSIELRQKFLDFFKQKGHTIIPSASLVPENDPTVLFTTAGMHPLVPYLMGEKHPGGKRIANIQKCIRTADIDEVGDKVHHTFFEMLGNWSFGDYFKDEAIEWSFEFLTDKKCIGLDKSRIAVSVFAGDDDAPFDQGSYDKWIALGIGADHIAKLPKKNNWWGPAGQTGPCGPDTEIFIWTGVGEPPENFQETHDDPAWVEVWNDVFMEYNKTADGKYEPLAQKNVDTGMGMERMLAVMNKTDDNYKTDLFLPIIQKIEEISGKKYEENEKAFRIIADHIKAAVFAISDGVLPSNKGAGYIIRRLIRRAIVKAQNLGIKENFTTQVTDVVFDIYKDTPYFSHSGLDPESIKKEIEQEETKFSENLKSAFKELEFYSTFWQGDMKPNKNQENIPVTGKILFDLFQSKGLPVEIAVEEAKRLNLNIKKRAEKEFYTLLKVHQELSRTASAGMFKGGLADAGAMAVKYHTATHLLLAALREVLGDHVLQKGSNINAERLRFDFSHPDKMTTEQIKQVEDLVNGQIQKNLPVDLEEMTLENAKKTGAMGVFESKYGDKVKVYTIGASKDNYFSREICGGPHIQNTSELGHFKIQKEESSSAGIRRIKAVLE